MGCIDDRNEPSKANLSESSQRVYEVIDSRLRTEFNKSIASLVSKNERYMDALKSYDEAQLVYEIARKRREVAETEVRKIENSINVRRQECYDNGRTTKKFVATHNMKFVPTSTVKKLLRVDELRALGKNADARKLKDEVLKTHGIQ